MTSWSSRRRAWARARCSPHSRSASSSRSRARGVIHFAAWRCDWCAFVYATSARRDARAARSASFISATRWAPCPRLSSSRPSPEIISRSARRKCSCSERLRHYPPLQSSLGGVGLELQALVVIAFGSDPPSVAPAPPVGTVSLGDQAPFPGRPLFRSPSIVSPDCAVVVALIHVSSAITIRASADERGSLFSPRATPPERLVGRLLRSPAGAIAVDRVVDPRRSPATSPTRPVHAPSSFPRLRRSSGTGSRRSLPRRRPVRSLREPVRTSPSSSRVVVAGRGRASRRPRRLSLIVDHHRCCSSFAEPAHPMSQLELPPVLPKTRRAALASARPPRHPSVLAGPAAVDLHERELPLRRHHVAWQDHARRAVVRRLHRVLRSGVDRAGASFAGCRPASCSRAFAVEPRHRVTPLGPDPGLARAPSHSDSAGVPSVEAVCRLAVVSSRSRRRPSTDPALDVDEVNGTSNPVPRRYFGSTFSIRGRTAHSALPIQSAHTRGPE